MQQCLNLARQAEGRTSPNPLVGALLVNAQGQVVGQGYHQGSGHDHAEVVAIKQAGSAARGSTLYVNLEPCCHTGKTPPCVKTVIESGVTRVVAGMMDPNPQVSGGGFQALREAGIAITHEVLEEDCRWLNRGFIKFHTKGLPWVCLKLASTLDGKIADRGGSSRWISSKEAQNYVHNLRNVFDCVMVGGATAVKDDPQLNVRGLEAGRNPMRVIIDGELFVSPEARVCQEDTGGQTMIFTSRKSLSSRGGRYPKHVKLFGVEAESVVSEEFDLSSALQIMGKEGVLTVLCEGGSRLSSGLLKSDLVDEVRWIVAPKILGDAKAIPAFSGVGNITLSECWEFRKVFVGLLGNDILVHGIMA